MTQASNLGSRLAAAASAFALSLFLISGTVSTPATAQAQSAGAYVGVVA